MLVLSLFPGIGILDKAFEEEGFCVVRGPDLLWGGDIRTFHPPAGRFDGVIGGPPCKAFSQLVHIVRARYGESAVADNLIPEFERCVVEAEPGWFLMENVSKAPLPHIAGYAVSSVVLNNRSFGGDQNRSRRFSFGIRGDQPVSLLPYVEIELMESPTFEFAVTASRGACSGLNYDRNGIPRPQRTVEARRQAGRMTIERKCELQGLPSNYLEYAPFTLKGKHEVIGNGVPLPLGRGVAKAIKSIYGRK